MKTKKQPLLIFQLFSFLLIFSNLSNGQSLITRKAIINLNSPDRVPNQYIVIYNENYLRSIQGDNFLSGLDNTTQIIADESNSEILHSYDSAIIGSAIYNTSQKRVQMLLYNPMVKEIYTDIKVHPLTTQYSAPFHLDRIDQLDFPLNDTYVYNNSGTGVNVYVFDSGIRATHNGIDGKVIYSKDFTSDHGGNFENIDAIFDRQGHGTGVASIIAGNKFGVAKGVSLTSLKVLDQHGDGMLSGTLDAIDYLLDEDQINYTLPAVANFSIGIGSYSNSDNAFPFLKDAIDGLISAGIVVVAAAGNDSSNYCDYPAKYSNIWKIPRFVCGEDWNRPEGLKNILQNAHK